jgi:nucleotide-binding universal stress UspA family protein
MDHSPRYRDRLTPDSGARATTVIIVGIDGSETSWDAFWWATGEARRLDCHIVAAFVSPTAEVNVLAASAAFAATPWDYAGLQQIATDRAGRLRSQLEGYANESNISLSFVHARGDTTAELMRIAEECHADIIVIGRSTKARHHLAGSLGRRLIARRNAPVVVVVP